MAGKLSREEAEALIGKRTALPGGQKQRGGNFLPSKETEPEKATPATGIRKGTIMKVEDALRRSEGFASGGSVRGGGCAIRGMKFKKV